MLDLRQDHHVHSTFSDGRNTIAQCLETARRRGLTHIAFCDHVRHDTDYLVQYVKEIRAWRHHFASQSGVDLSIEIAVEAKILDLGGRLDIPPCLNGIERISVADHQLATDSGLLGPSQVRAALADASLSPRRFAELYVRGLLMAIESARLPVRIAHPFSFLPKVGLCEDLILDIELDTIAQALLRKGGQAEASERWRGPSHRVLSRWHQAGVELVASTDAHHAKDIGAYVHVAHLAQTLDCAA